MSRADCPGAARSSVRRLHLLCANLLHRDDRRLTLPPLNMQPEERLSALVERWLEAMQSTRPQTVRGFFALVNQHMRWVLNDLARRLDQGGRRPRVARSDRAGPGDERLAADTRRPPHV